LAVVVLVVLVGRNILKVFTISLVVVVVVLVVM
jgi:hypothetical protein